MAKPPILALGGIEAGGSKFICGIGTGPADLKTIRIPTTTPEATIAGVVAFFREHADIAAIGIGSFGPVDLRGRITSTPKLAWQNFDLGGAIRKGSRCKGRIRYGCECRGVGRGSLGRRARRFRFPVFDGGNGHRRRRDDSQSGASRLTSSRDGPHPDTSRFLHRYLPRVAVPTTAIASKDSRLVQR